MEFLEVSIVDDNRMRELNKTYRGEEYPTDVLSFSLNENLLDGNFLLGEVVINKDQARRQAGDYGHSYEEELAELVKHGVLHLLGVHHKGDE